MPFDVENLFSVASADPTAPKLSELFVRMALATVLGSLIAFRAWRRLMPFMSRPSLQSAQSQTLIAAAGALMVVVIGDSPARAFGLVGLGSFIRFRSGISDPRDAAVLFVMIGIGMACGLGLFDMALGSTAFVALLLTVFDYGARRQTRPAQISIQAEDAAAVQRRVREVFPEARMCEVGSNAPELGKDNGKLVIELMLRPDQDAESIRQAFDQKGVTGIRRVALSDED